MKLRTLALRFLRIGATGFGGPMALIGMMQHLLVERTAEVKAEDLADGVAIGQMLPGPVAVSCCTHLGYRLRGVAGALVSTGSLVFPAFLLMLLITPLYLHYGKVPQVAGFFQGVGPAVVAVILAAAWRLGRKFIADWRAGSIAAVVCGGALVGQFGPVRLNPILLIVAAGVLGMLLSPRAKDGRQG